MTGYAIHTDLKYAPLEVIDAGRLAAACTERWWNQPLGTVNDCVVRLGVFDGEFHWHKHDREDELFFVLEGRLLVDLADVADGEPQGGSQAGAQPRTVELAELQGVLVPR